MNGEEGVWRMEGYVLGLMKAIAGLKSDRGICAKFRRNSKRAMENIDARRLPWPLDGGDVNISVDDAGLPIFK